MTKQAVLGSLLLGSLLAGACAAAPGKLPGDGDDDVVDAMLTVADAGFFVDEDLRWAGSARPEVTGTVADPRTTVEVMAGDVSHGKATVDGETWHFTFPTNVLSMTPTDISFVARLGTGAQAVVERTYAVDPTPPDLTALATTIRNELEDVVSFNTDGEIFDHEHIGAPITLGASPTDCPDVFKHAYLMDPGEANPIRWRLVATDTGVGLDPATPMVRFGVQGGAFGPWRPANGALENGHLVVDVDAVRSGPDGDPFIATTEGKLVVQMTAADRLGRTATTERCWTNHPLAVPLAATIATEAANHPLALRQNSLVNSPVLSHNLAAELINPASKGLSVMDYDLINSTEESAFVSFALDRPAIFTRRNYLRQSALKLVRSISNAPVLCTSSAQACAQGQHPALFQAPFGVVDEETPDHYAVRVFRVLPNGTLGTEIQALAADAQAGTFRFELAGRASPGAPVQRYRIATVLRGLTTLLPGGASGDPGPTTISDTALFIPNAIIGITGELVGNVYTGCSRVSADFTRCIEQSDFQHYRALTRIEVAMTAPLGIQASASPSALIQPRSLGQLAAPRRLPSFSYGSSETLPPGL